MRSPIEQAVTDCDPSKPEGVTKSRRGPSPGVQVEGSTTSWKWSGRKGRLDRALSIGRTLRGALAANDFTTKDPFLTPHCVDGKQLVADERALGTLDLFQRRIVGGRLSAVPVACRGTTRASGICPSKQWIASTEVSSEWSHVEESRRTEFLSLRSTSQNGSDPVRRGGWEF